MQSTSSDRRSVLVNLTPKKSRNISSARCALKTALMANGETVPKLELKSPHRFAILRSTNSDAPSGSVTPVTSKRSRNSSIAARCTPIKGLHATGEAVVKQVSMTPQGSATTQSTSSDRRSVSVNLTPKKSRNISSARCAPKMARFANAETVPKLELKSLNRFVILLPTNSDAPSGSVTPVTSKRSRDSSIAARCTPIKGLDATGEAVVKQVSMTPQGSATTQSTSSDRRPVSVNLTPKKSRNISSARCASKTALIANAETVPKLELKSPHRPKSRRIPVEKSSGGFFNENEVKRVVPSGSGRKSRSVLSHETIMPLSCDVLENTDAMDVSEDDAEEQFETFPGHVQQCVNDLELEDQECYFLKPVTPDATEEDNFGLVRPDSGHARQKTGKVSSVGDAITDIPDIGVSPSTSGTIAQSKCTNEIHEGSDLDSEFNDEFDNLPIESAGIGRDIPDDDELEDPVRTVITNIEKGMDDEVDRLLGVSSSFNWVEDYQSFRGGLEEFTGPTPGPVRDYDSPYDAFIDIWDKDIMELIARETNRYAKQFIDSLKSKEELTLLSRMHEWKDTSVDELYVLFGIFMFMSIVPRTSVYEYWKSNDYLELTKFRSLMSYNRYILLNKFVCFADNSSTRQNLLQTEETTSAKKISLRLDKISSIIEHLGNKFNSLYNLEKNVVVDESLISFKDRLSWIQTTSSKSARFGIKSYELCESQTGYMARFQMYTSKSDEVRSDQALGIDLGGKCIKVVLELLQGLEHRGHCVTMDNFYNSPSLARYLKAQGFDCLGTLRKNRRNVPDAISETPNKLPNGTIITRHSGDVSIVTWQEHKLVNIMSTYHDDSTYTRAGKRVAEPICVRDYNKYMGGVDQKDQKLSMYLLERKRNVRWTMKIFKRLLNVSISNAFIMFVESLKRRNKVTMRHRDFRLGLATSLVDLHRPCQLRTSEPVDQLMRLRRDVVHVPKYESGKNKRKRCTLCQKLRVTKLVRTQCITCGVFLCFENCWKSWHSLEDFNNPNKRPPSAKQNELDD